MVTILAHYYGLPSTETLTTETTIVWCHKNSWIFLTSTYCPWLLRPTITIRFDSKWKKHYLHSTNSRWWLVHDAQLMSCTVRFVMHWWLQIWYHRLLYNHCWLQLVILMTKLTSLIRFCQRYDISDVIDNYNINQNNNELLQNISVLIQQLMLSWSLSHPFVPMKHRTSSCSRL